MRTNIDYHVYTDGIQTRNKENEFTDDVKKKCGQTVESTDETRKISGMLLINSCI